MEKSMREIDGLSASRSFAKEDSHITPKGRRVSFTITSREPMNARQSSVGTRFVTSPRVFRDPKTLPNP
ncbi:hypothetical protein RSSM_01141 [Rhodopirellula sallentina SM41]|uniref:Uncharacterized protein n=1 Tax=Rhodopirellula sallentina SM41 TaxID=1263870 RepID=M5U832_9BACT|nr:hypothetical protein RSSM_01141 [Rhodopirellula sallentina SM41]